MRRKLLSCLWWVAVCAPCRAQVQQFIRFNSTMDLSPLAEGSAAALLSDINAIAVYESLTRTIFEAGLSSLPSVNPLFVSPPEILSLGVVGAVEDSSSDKLAITFQTTMSIVSSSELTDQNLLVDVKFGPYWYSDAEGHLGYWEALTTQAPTVFPTIRSMEIDFTVARIFDPSTTSPPAPTTPPVSLPTVPAPAPVVAPAIPPVFPPFIVSLTSQPTIFVSAEGVEQFIRVNGTMQLTGVAPNSTEIFLSDAADIEAYEALTQGTFQGGITDALSNSSVPFTTIPEIISLKLVGAQSLSEDEIVVIFETTMSVFAPRFLTEQDFYREIRFGQYWADPNRSFAYLFDLRTIFPALFSEDGTFQISFGIGQVVQNPVIPDDAATEAPSAVVVKNISGAPSAVLNETEVPTDGLNETMTEIPVATLTSAPSVTPSQDSGPKTDALNSQLKSDAAFATTKASRVGIAVLLGAALATML